MPIFNVSNVSGAGPTYNLTVDSSAGVLTTHHFADTSGNIYRVTSIPDGTHIDVEDDVAPDAPEGTPVTGVGSSYVPTTNQQLSQLPLTVPGWGEVYKRDMRRLDTQVQRPAVTQVTSVAAFSTSSATDVLVTGMTITPGAGNWLAMFSGQVTGDGGAKNGFFSIYANGSKIAHSERVANDVKVQLGSTQALITGLGAGQAIEVRGRGDDTLLVDERSLIVMRVA